jgi:S-adenosylmethionine:tRNA ribosyltransferase-isomerase
MRTSDFHFDLPPELIAQQPAAQRDQSRLLVLQRREQHVEHRQFRDVLDYLRAGDVLVLNNSRVIRARLRGVNAKTGGAFELLLLEENATNDWWAMMKPGKRARIGTQIQIGNRKSEIGNIQATVIATNEEGHRRLQFFGTENILNELDALGEVPLPPYIRREPGAPASGPARLETERRAPARLVSAPNAQHRADPEVGAPDIAEAERYQTVFAAAAGSVAAPTAGLHFTEQLLAEIRARGVDVHFVTLHVGLGTFAPVKAETLAGHVMHEERYEISAATAAAVNRAKAEGRRVVAVGTTSVRVLESAAGAPASGPARFNINSGSGRTRIFIHPPYEFKIVDALLTNFHLPCSTLLMLVSAFAAPGLTTGREKVLRAYAEAIRERYRFFSFGDAMFVS